MRNLLLHISYNGSRYHGYQVQQNAITITEVLQDAIERVLKIREDIVGCSRTDTGVHARHYYCNMKTERTIPPDALVKALNCVLPDDIAILDCVEVPMEFHARYHTLQKEYVYQVWNHPIKNPFLEHLAYHYRYPIDEALLHRAAQDYLGTHDFTSFACVRSKVKDHVRTIHEFEVVREGDMVTFRVLGDGFLYHMVRIMVGTLLKINEGFFAPDAIPGILAGKDRCLAGKTAPPQGLYLNRVIYGGEWFAPTTEADSTE